MHGFELHLVGPVLKEMKPFLSKYAGTFRHTGAVEHALLPDVYSQASLFVLPSLQEGLAMVQAEAMACGLPLVCTPSTGCEDLFTHGVQGLIVQPGDVLALRQAILDLYHDPARRDAMAAAAIARASEALTWQRYGESIAAAYQEALRSKASD
jgi:glycosyltransferase involved in cell wall biosynthesis